MNQILIGKNVAYGAKIGGGTISGMKEVNQLAAGALAVFNPEGTLLTAANVVANMADRKGVIFAVGSGVATTGADVTVTTERLKVNYKKQAYVAPVLTVKVLGAGATNGSSLNLPGTLVEGTEAFLKVIDTTPGILQTGLDTRRYSHYVRVGDTPTIIIQDLVDQINADTDSKVTAAIVGAGTGIVFTAKAVGTNFAITKDGILINAVLDEAENPLGTTDSVAMKYGEGTPAQVLLLERTFSPQQGNTNKVYQAGLWWTKTEKTDSTATYDSYTIQWMGKKPTTLSGNLNTVALEVIVVMPPAATQQAAFESVMAEVFGNAETEETGA